MLAFTKKTNYGLIALSRLAATPKKILCAREIAEQSHVPAYPLMNVLKALAAAGYVESVRGAHGGYRLALRPDEIRLGGVIDVLEGPIRDSACLGGRVPADRTCDEVDTCPRADPVHRVHRKLRDFLHTLALSDIMGHWREDGPDEPSRPTETQDAANAP